MNIFHKLLLVLVALAGSTSAFGPRFKKGRKIAAAMPSIKAVSNENSRDAAEPTTKKEEKQESGALFHLESLFEDVTTTGEDSYSMFDLLRGRAEELATETFDDEILCTGDECDLDCDIPKEWSAIKGEVEVENVMDFLGIRRAEPLRRAADWQ